MRDAAIEAQLVSLEQAPRDEVLARCRITRRTDPGYIPSECLLHFVRASRDEKSTKWFEHLYKALSARVLRSLPSDPADGKNISMTRERIRDRVFERFVEMLAGDRQAYDKRLDFFEVRFDRAMRCLRLDAQKQAWRAESRTQPLSYDDDGGELSPEIERAAGSINPFEGPEFDDRASRLRLDAAIEALPTEQRITVQMIMLNYQIVSDDPTVPTICKVLGRSRKSIWNYRDRAVKALQEALAAGENK